MTCKHQKLHLADIESCRLPSDVEAVLASLDQEYTCRAEVRILDLGCGRGAHVLKLRLRGYSAYGIEVDPNVISKGISLFEDSGFDHGQCIRLAVPGSAWPFEDSFFHVVFSDQVLEHVADLDGVLFEMARVTKRGGIGFHRFPAQFIRVEPHVLVPYVHWLPKINVVRSLWLSLFYSRLPAWNGQDNMDRRERIKQFLSYLHHKTHYRSLMIVLGRFKKAGHIVKLGGIRSPRNTSVLSVLKHRLKVAYRSTFVSVEILTTRI